MAKITNTCFFFYFVLRLDLVKYDTQVIVPLKLNFLQLMLSCFVYRLWEAGWKGRYYKNKFQLSESDVGYDEFRKEVVGTSLSLI